MPKKTIDKTNKFFMAACMQGQHSFLCLGVEDKGEFIPLIEVGKAMPLNERHRYPQCLNEIVIVCEMIFNSLHSQLLNEKSFIDCKIDNVSRPITYTAYEISYDNYLQFIRALKQINPELCAYIPIDEEKDDKLKSDDKKNTVTLDYKELKTLKADDLKHATINHLNATSKTLSFDNSCRTAVIDLVKLGSPPDVHFPLPDHFYESFACQNAIKNGQFEEKLYILPTPPSGYHLDKPKKEILSKLYKQLEKTLSFDTKLPETRKEFESLKTLYVTEAAKAHQTTQALAKAIRQWSYKNPDYVHQSQPSCSFFCSKSTNVFDEINAEYGNEKSETTHLLITSKVDP